VSYRFGMAHQHPIIGRLARFGMVGACATGLQETTLALFVWLGLNAVLANGIGFFAGAQLSFTLSKKCVWGDRSSDRARALKFYTTAAFALVINTAVFTLASHLSTPSIMASLCGVAAGTSVTFFVNDKLTFRGATVNDGATNARTSVFDYDLTIVIPAFMEATRIGDTLQQVADWLDNHNLGKIEVIVVSAHSPDNTIGIVRQHAQLFENFVLVNAGPKVGKGRDVAIGMLHARGRYRLFFDADLATPLRHLEQVQRFIEDNGVVGVGVRNVGHYHNTFVRNMLSRTASAVARVLIAPNVRDTQCGFKVFRGDVAETLFGRMRVMGWNSDMEIIALARKYQHSITTFEIPDWIDPKAHDEGLVGDSILNVVIRGAVEPFMIRLRILAGKYDTPGPIYQYMQTARAEFPAKALAQS